MAQLNEIVNQYAAVEFENKECAVVPLLWVIDNNEHCYWPKTSISTALKRLVKDATPPASSWPKFKVVKIYFILDSLKLAETKLNEIIEQSTNSESGEIEGLRLLNYENVEEEDDANRLRNNSQDGNKLYDTFTSDININDDSKMEKRKLKEKSSSKSKRFRNDKNRKSNISKSNKSCTKNSGDSFNEWSQSSESEDGNNNKKIPNKSQTRIENNMEYDSSPVISSRELLLRKGFNRENQQILTYRNLHQARSRESTPVSTFTNSQELTSRNVISPSLIISQSRPFINNTSRGSPLHENHVLLNRPSTSEGCQYLSSPVNTSQLSFEETVINKLETIITIQDQNSTRINEIYRILGDGKVKNYLTRPDGFPVLPIDKKEKLKEVERQILEQTKFDYLKNRLAAIGGSSVRSAINNMLKYIFTNKVAKKFNWAGHNDKKPFKNSKLWEAIREAVHLHFCDSKPSDLNDAIIIKAVQDWLRLAAQRYGNQKRSLRQ